MDEGTIVGLITDRDIAIKVVAVGIDPQTASTSEFMSPHLLTGRPEMSLQEASRPCATISDVVLDPGHHR